MPRFGRAYGGRSPVNSTAPTQAIGCRPVALRIGSGPSDLHLDRASPGEMHRDRRTAPATFAAARCDHRRSRRWLQPPGCAGLRLACRATPKPPLRPCPRRAQPQPHVHRRDLLPVRDSLWWSSRRDCVQGQVGSACQKNSVSGSATASGWVSGAACPAPGISWIRALGTWSATCCA